MKIKKVEIEGFRAYKLKKDGIFDFTLSDGTPSNFVALYAPNGFGKSSFYDAVEWAFTNNLERYAGDHTKKIINSRLAVQNNHKYR
ncbi:AAA family ATPase [Citrobacter portucalensis]|uniref:AAA family ATPase n=1 Tax=Citrobacter portucalensis TaxID=1639133 RepID=UPI0008FFB1D1|nr:AAA family ATPase [Citrobacter portucalensis]